MMHREQIGAKQTDEGMWLGSPEKETEADPKRITFDDLHNLQPKEVQEEPDKFLRQLQNTDTAAPAWRLKQLRGKPKQLTNKEQEPKKEWLPVLTICGRSNIHVSSQIPHFFSFIETH